jgi:hypothetical protein
LTSTRWSCLNRESEYGKRNIKERLFKGEFIAYTGLRYTAIRQTRGNNTNQRESKYFAIFRVVFVCFAILNKIVAMP